MLDNYIESLTRQSEFELRKKNMNLMLAEDYDKKVVRSENTVDEFIDILGLENVYVSTSGGKDSAVLSKLCKGQHPSIKHIMFNTGLEYQATLDIAKEQGAEIIPPVISWVKSCEKHGYPIVSKNVSRRLGDIGKTPISTCISLFNQTYGLSNKWLHLTSKDFIDFKVSLYCCTEFKKNPSKRLKLNPILGTRIQESNNRKSAWKKSGCNSYNMSYTKGVSRPISLWLDDDVNRYIVENNVHLSKLYTQYEQKRTGCKICPYGAQIDGSRFDLLKELEPKVYEHFIYHTKLGHILMVSDVDIVSDEKYMGKKQLVDKQIANWHKEHKGNDNYISYRMSLARNHYSAEMLIETLDYLNHKAPINNFDYLINLLRGEFK